MKHAGFGVGFGGGRDLAVSALRPVLASKPPDAPGFTYQASSFAKPGAVLRRLISRRIPVPNIKLLDNNYFIGWCMSGYRKLCREVHNC